jgi:protein-L-isoaspartate(D-aspartate) O-methyltransferase
MVYRQLKPRGIHDKRLLDAFLHVARELFIPTSLYKEAYNDYPLAIGEGQTISQPFITALMIQYLELTGVERVLEVGTGSGYQTAILAVLSKWVYTVERHSLLAARAQRALSRIGVANLDVVVGDGSEGLAQFAPYERIIVSAAAPQVPPALVNQLVDGGILVIPVGNPQSQRLHVIRREQGVPRVYVGESCIFVPLIGSQGWAERE